MELTPALIVSIAGLGVSIFVHAITVFFKTPKEYHGELRGEVNELKRENKELITQFRVMEEALRNLTKSLDGMSRNFSDFTKQFYQHVRSTRGPGKS